MRRPSPWLCSSAVVAALLAGGCTSEEPAADTDRIVVNPPAEGADHTHAPGESDADPVGDGTRASAGGYRIADLRVPTRTDGPGEMSFRILGPEGRPVTDYAEQQTKLMHLYVVRTDFSVYRHVHPTLADDGTWTVPVDLAEAGGYRVIADFLPSDADRPVVLGKQVLQPPAGAPRPVPREGEGTDGSVRVRVDGAGRVGADGRLRLVVSTPDGRPVTLGSYLGTTAHVSGFRIADRARDQLFVHVHPYGEPEITDDGAELTFHTAFERAGDYRLFVQVRVDGIVHTVPITATIT
ncbi:hypothetical protein SFC88_18850 [Nocardioides sp. HM23]|uniref:hypothetical protein n=1 Tax=Nocardioides bizhenqiangii TaxID=3095076 RepID=UPI002ACA73AE|nr:hypothetical protein [Nocardioides sp. HM23]MDZ5622906.1 hypothetical protein [Nocardioides sp. HM23]